MNVTLMGMPGSGKSFIGKKLADWLGYTLIDFDKILEKKYSLPLQRIVEKLGTQAFLDEEEEVVLSQVAGSNCLVLSPGGSVIYRTKAMEHLKKISKIGYLKTSLDVIKSRIGNTPRGIVDPDKINMEGLYLERVPQYEQWADFVIDGDEKSEIVISSILEEIDAV
jgi:shikimate kinase